MAHCKIKACCYMVVCACVCPSPQILLILQKTNEEYRPKEATFSVLLASEMSDVYQIALVNLFLV